MRKPPTREAEVWLVQYTSAFSRWAGSAFQDVGSLAEAANALQSLLERCPDYAPEIECLASIACFASRRGNVPHLIATLATTGLEAGAMVVGDEHSSKPSAILLLSLAEAERIAERRLEGLEALRRLKNRLDASPVSDALGPWISARLHVLLGELHELGLELELARQAYATAVAEIEPVLADAGKREAFRRAWAEALMDPFAGVTLALDDVALPELNTLAIASAIGLARSIGAHTAQDERAAAARRAWHVIETVGPSPDLSPFDVIPIIAAVSSDEAVRFAAALLAALDQQRSRLAMASVPEGFTDPAAIAIVQDAQCREAERLDRQRPAYVVAGKLGLALALRSEGDPRAQSTVTDAISTAVESRLGAPLVCALGLGLEITAARERTGAGGLMRAFLIALAAELESDPKFFATPRFRVLLDGAAATAASLVLDELGNGNDAGARRRASAILDLLRRPDPPPAQTLMPPPARKTDVRAQDDATLLVADTVGRIRVALREREDSVALVMQSLGTEVTFLVLESDDRPIQHVVAGSEYRLASAALAEVANGAKRRTLPRGNDPETVVADAGRRAFHALPQSIQQAIATHRTILLAPDFRGREDVVPFELMHDGTAYLSATRILARFTSLAHMASTLDTRVLSSPRRRALVTAAPVVEGYDPLDLAALEQEEIVSTLQQRGFDVPTIDAARLSAGFYTERLGYVDVLHVSGHGESGAGMECLVLPKKQRLTVDDLLERPQYRVPFVYLNTCNLGQTRYLGAGVSRGLAYAFSELGAPAVVAHTAPVSDSVAMRLAVAFYDSVTERSVGEAMLEARRALLDDGEPPWAWASTILLGDPDHSVVGTRSRDLHDLGSDVLDAYMTIENNGSNQVAAMKAALNALRERDNPRIEAAVGVVRTLADVQDLHDPAQAAALDRAIRAADALGHLPARALLRFVKAVNAVDTETREQQALFKDAIRFLAPLVEFEPDWGTVLRQAREKLAVERSSEKGFEIQTILPTSRSVIGSGIGGRHGTKVHKKRARKGPDA
jgi:CHAT domain-containing protein